MESMNNLTDSITNFILIGFPGLQDYKIILFGFFLAMFLVTCSGNLCILGLVILDQRLHTPMYFFLWNLSLLDVLMVTAITPKMLAVFLEHNTISFAACFVQMYMIISFGATEILLVAAMAYDRYVAVVKPLHYNVIINLKTCIVIAATVWMLGFLMPLIPVTLASYLPFCGSNEIMHCFCDYPTVISLACTDVSSHAIGSLCLALIVVYVPFIFISSVEGKRKVFSTCLTHLLVVGLFYCPLLLSYVLPGAGVKLSTEAYNTMVIVGNIIPPMLNPLIYSFRNKEIKNSIYKLFMGKRTIRSPNSQANLK
uniref:Olfactory receptor n=1 Tax=Erpetoichthys calabaricus TaxID=27687 RepID=A0A8C4SRE2_ERPCA